eukprot:TRINITY_DN3838_c0_g1_i1.p1 TRINITY_DN3838_c0_g1~~TRINITY_DN3838_c0_g1_i1.p1  ORF type:complete len:336 (+),score=50.10 TRINITY_DN3838_c0_g1_i1:224-1231(+)
MAASHGIGQKTISLTQKLEPGSYLVLAEVERKVKQGDSEEEVEWNEMNVAIIADMKPGRFHQICDIDVCQALRGALKNFVWQQPLRDDTVTVIERKDDQRVVHFQSHFIGGFAVALFINEGNVPYAVDFTPDKNQISIGELLSIGPFEGGTFKSIVRPGSSQFFAIRARLKSPGAHSVISIKAVSTSEAPTIQDSLDTFVDPRFFSVSLNPDFSFDVSNFSNLILRRYIYRNGALHERRWKNNQTQIFVYSLSDANGLYILYENLSDSISLEERMNLKVKNLRLANDKEKPSTNLREELSIIVRVEPKKSSLVFFEAIGTDGFEYTIESLSLIHI